MKTITSSLLFLLLAATSAGTLADNPKAEQHDARKGQSTNLGNRPPIAAPVSTTSPSDSVEPRKQKRCRQHVKTVGVGCKKRPSH